MKYTRVEKIILRNPDMDIYDGSFCFKDNGAYIKHSTSSSYVSSYESNFFVPLDRISRIDFYNK